eukprot:1737506-Pleurochrysis_carterae.AAC.1
MATARRVRRSSRLPFSEPFLTTSRPFTPQTWHKSVLLTQVKWTLRAEKYNASTKHCLPSYACNDGGGNVVRMAMAQTGYLHSCRSF